MSLPTKIKEEGIIDYLEKLKPEIDGIIEKYLPKKTSKEWLEFVFEKPKYAYNQKASQEALIKPAWEFLSRGGKRWRPALFLLIVEATGGDVEKVKDFLIIPEVIHNGSIIIDDIEDRGELRRGKPCLHKVFGVDVALNAGNFMYFLPLLALMKNKDKFSPQILVRAYETYAQEMINIHLGQGTDIYWHKGQVEKIDEKEYFQMCAFKTGCLSRMAAKLAVVLSGQGDELIEVAGNIAETLGIAFQIQDDILDIALSGQEREGFGKSFGNDIKEGKRTLIVIHVLEVAENKDKKRLLQILNRHTSDLGEIKEAINIINKYDGVGYARKVAKKIVKEAWEEADKILPESKAKKRLNQFVNYLIERKV